MKLLALIFVVILARVLAINPSYNATRTKIKEAHAKCQNDTATKTDEKILSKLKTGENFENIPNVAAHIFCVSKELCMQNQNGTLDKAIIQKLVEGLNETAKNKATMNDILTQCATQLDTPEKTATHLVICLFEKKVNIGCLDDEGHSKH